MGVVATTFVFVLFNNDQRFPFQMDLVKEPSVNE
jgi:hypothetical protein